MRARARMRACARARARARGGCVRKAAAWRAYCSVACACISQWKILMKRSAVKRPTKRTSNSSRKMVIAKHVSVMAYLRVPKRARAQLGVRTKTEEENSRRVRRVALLIRD
eukprot:5725137-Pleurochrysis_carterae.AAC.4